MKLTNEQLAVIKKYIYSYKIDSDKLISYLEKHKTIKKDVFSYCSKVSQRSWGGRGFCMFLTSDDPVYTAIDRETFIRRIPFYFSQVQVGPEKRSGLSFIIPVNCSYTKEQYEEFYTDLEWMFYELAVPLDAIFNYSREQLHSSDKREDRDEGGSLFRAISLSMSSKDRMQPRALFAQWRHYLHLCQNLGWTDYTPSRFITSYNLALEASNQVPITYYPIKELGTYFVREDNACTCQGHFPCDKNGRPILKWTNIRVTAPKSLEFSGERSAFGKLTIALSPWTTIHILLNSECESDDDGDASWVQIYAGPRTMQFDHNALREYRTERGMTQTDVADAIGTSVRTYQKWECGETTPDGHNLLRLINWLNIEDVQCLIKYNDCQDSSEKKEV